MPPSPLQSTSTRHTRRHATTPLPFSIGNGVRSPPYPSRYRPGSPLSTHPEQLLVPAGRLPKALAPDSYGVPSPSYRFQDQTSASDLLPKPSDVSTSRHPQGTTAETMSTSRQPPPHLHVSPPRDSDTDDMSSLGSPPSPFGAISTFSDIGPITPAEPGENSSASTALAVTSPVDGISEDSPMTPPEREATHLPADVKPRTIKSLKSNPPRPPNAWILYRSEKLKAIAAGEKLANLDAILAEQQAEVQRAQEGSSRAPRGGGKQRAGSQASSKTSKGTAKGKKKAGDQDTESEPTDGRSPPQDQANSDGNTGSKAVPQAEISKVISLMWKREKKEEKARFEKMAQARKAEHALKYPYYKFQPMKKEEKQRLKEEMQGERLKARQEVLEEKARMRKKASKAKPTVAMVELGEPAKVEFVEPASGPIVKKPRKARAKKMSTPWTTTSRTEWGPEDPQGSGAAMDQGLSRDIHQDQTAGQAQFYRQVLPPFPEGLAQNMHQDVIQEPNSGVYPGAFVGIPADIPQTYWQGHSAPGPHTLNYYPAPNSEAFQAFPQQANGPMDTALRQDVPFPPYPSTYAAPPAPPMHPGFAVGNGEVVPYIFEPMPFGMAAPEFHYRPSYDGPSSKEEPAIGTMGPVECQPLGVSEAELAEMWALLQDDAVDHGSGTIEGDPPALLLGEAWSGNPEASVNAWSQFGMPFNEPEEQDIPLTQLSGTVVSHIANDWASYDQSPAAGPSLATPVYHPRQTKVSGYTAPASVYGPMGSSPQVYQPSADITPKYIKVAISSAESSGQQGLSRAVYQGPPLSSHGAMSPLSPPSDPAVMGFHNSPSYRHPESHQPLERRYQEYSERRHQALPSPPVQHRQVSSRLPTPQTSGFFGNQLTPPAYHMPPAGFSGSRHSSISGEPTFTRLPEGERPGEGYRVPSFAFADAGRVLSGISSNGAFVDKDTAYGTPYYRDFSFSSVMSRSVSVASAERENREGR